MSSFTALTSLHGTCKIPSVSNSPLFPSYLVTDLSILYVVHRLFHPTRTLQKRIRHISSSLSLSHLPTRSRNTTDCKQPFFPPSLIQSLHLSLLPCSSPRIRSGTVTSATQSPPMHSWQTSRTTLRPTTHPDPVHGFPGARELNRIGTVICMFIRILPLLPSPFLLSNHQLSSTRRRFLSLTFLTRNNRQIRAGSGTWIGACVSPSPSHLSRGSPSIRRLTFAHSSIISYWVNTLSIRHQ